MVCEMFKKWNTFHISLLDDTFYSFFTSPYLPPLLEVERTRMTLNTDDGR